MAIAVGLLTTVSVIQVYLLWRAARALAAYQRVEERISHLGDAVALLTETSESGFRALALELTRPNDIARRPPAPAASRAASRRIVQAANRGVSVPDIAAAEHVSDGEVRLRLQLSEQQKPAAKARAPRTRQVKEAVNGALRA